MSIRISEATSSSNYEKTCDIGDPLFFQRRCDRTEWDKTFIATSGATRNMIFTTSYMSTNIWTHFWDMVK